jgi:hypothetical protein
MDISYVRTKMVQSYEILAEQRQRWSLEMFDRHRPHAFRVFRVSPERAQSEVQAQQQAATERSARATGLQGWAVHLARNRTCVIVVEAWRDTAAYRADPDARLPGSHLYQWVGTGGREPTPVNDGSAGLIVIDVFPTWRALSLPVSLFNVKNGEAFNRHPGCISTTVLRGVGAGSIATYARWRSEADFFDAFEDAVGAHVSSTDEVNAAASRKTFGLIRPDYNVHELVAFWEHAA